VGAGLSPRDFGPSQRCKAADIIGITALWADIDISGPLHKKANLPPDEEIAIRLLKTIEIPYSVLVHSGQIFPIDGRIRLRPVLTPLVMK
jgi:hypothetical protein